MNFNKIKITLVTVLVVFQLTKLNSQSPGIIFMNAKGEVASTYEAGDEIYGKIILPKPLKDYLENGAKPTSVKIKISTLSEGVNGPNVTRVLRNGELDKSIIEFDVIPSLQRAKDVYDNNFSFYAKFYGVNMNSNKVEEFKVSFDSESYYGSGFTPVKVSGPISIDYSKVSKQQIEALFEKGKKVAEAAEKNGSKIVAIENAEIVKAMPLPVVFTKASKAGYAGYSKAVITNMIKARYKINNVYMLTFDEPEGAGDFTSLKDLNNYPSEKLGNHVFYFAFKDETDGQYKFAGGRLRMLYEGNGKYSEAFIFPYSPLMNNDPKFPFDYSRKAMGFESVFFMDGAKIKN